MVKGTESVGTDERKYGFSPESRSRKSRRRFYLGLRVVKNFRSSNGEDMFESGKKR